MRPSHGKRAFTLVEMVVAFVIGLAVLIMLFELLRMVNRASFEASQRQETLGTSVLLMERLLKDLEAALPEKAWVPGPTPPKFLEGAPGYNASVAFSIAPPDTARVPVPRIPVRYDYDPAKMTVQRVSPDGNSTYEGLELFVVTPFTAQGRTFFRILICARFQSKTDVKVRALPLTTTVCPRFLRAHQALPYWAWPPNDWEKLVGP